MLLSKNTRDDWALFFSLLFRVNASLIDKSTEHPFQIGEANKLGSH